MTTEAIQWASADDPMSGVPSEIVRLLSDNGRSYGYGYGPGISMMFGSAQGDITVHPGQWVVKHEDGRITVEDRAPGL